MVTAFALKYISRRMSELGYGDNYHLRWRHIIIPGGQELLFEAGDDIFIIIQPAIIPDDPIRVKSERGVLNTFYPLHNEAVFEHTGVIRFDNSTGFTRPIYMIQVIPFKTHLKND
jgi:hypothetical protein